MLEEKIMQQYPAEDRAELLEGVAENVLENYQYRRILTADEVTEIEKNLSTASVELSKLKDQFAIIQAEWKAKMKPFADEAAEAVELLKNGSVIETGTCFEIMDEPTETVGIYTALGVKIGERRATPKERQRTIYREMRKNA